ncbi:MAG: bifunctional metallophosphatase/5'-nucleotidase [Spirochaetaceae bacterium 4572_59]|nr:MAG: bifunctional metallophosphatase/5'-nucleotidase [Spirochaetaceae bacterium 4572_59]
MKRTFFNPMAGIFLLTLFVFTGCMNNKAPLAEAQSSEISMYDSQKDLVEVIGEKDLTEQTIAFGATADIHGRIYSYDYAIDSPDKDAGLTKVYTAIIQESAVHPNMILMDVGDTVQDNSAELFNDLDTHPMIQALNKMDYDVWVLGNHEFNFDRSFVDRNLLNFDGAVLSANIKEEMDGSHYAMPYKIFNVNGCRVGVIGILPPHIPEWEASSPSHFKGLQFEGTLVSVREAMAEMDGKYDVLVGAFHMGRTDDRGAEAVYDIADAVPEFSVIFGGHEHAKYVEERNGVAIIEPGKYGWALARADIHVKKEGDSWKVLNVNAFNVETKALPENPILQADFAYVHEQSIADANVVVGEISAEFVDGVDYLTGEDDISTMPRAQIEDTAVIDLINETQMFYSAADVSSAALFNFGSTLHKGDFKKKDVAYIYKYPNTLVAVNITGENLKAYMEWSASYYNTVKDGDLTISFNKDIRGYNYDMFSGVDYEIDLRRPAGERVKNVMFDGAPLDMAKTYKLAVNNYRFGTLTKLELVSPADKYYDSYEELQDAGRIRSLIIQYVQEEKGGVVDPDVDNNWKIIGFDFDNPMIDTLIERVNAGSLTIPTSEDGRTLNIKSITAADL